MLSTHSRRLRFEPLENRRLLTTLTVNTLLDENNGIGTGGVSLREAVAAATTGDTINFSVTGTINLLGTSGFGQIAISKSVTILGPGSNLLTIRAFDPDASADNDGDGRRVFLVADSATTLNVTISGLTLTNGDPMTPNENDGGGAILNQENLTLNSCILTGNFAANGGAILSTDGTLTINDCAISGNNAGDGGAVLITGGSLAVARSTIANNQVTNSGAGILSQSRPVTIIDSTISGNLADEFGGGLYQFGSSLSVTGSTISGNAAHQDPNAAGSGGGIFNSTGALSLLNCTISGNSAGVGEGGGIFSDTSQTITIKFSTITGNVVANVSGSSGGGIRTANTASLDHTIVAGNLRGASTRDDVSGTFDAYYSLIGDARSAAVNNSAGSLIGTSALPINAKLAPLANNGGLTLTHALSSGSPALEAGDPGAIAGTNGVPQFDQRGTPFSRVVDFDGVGGARIDIGAVEMAAAAPSLPGDYNLNHSVDAADFVLWRKTTGTSVPQPYAGADGDGNGAINSNDYTVWRSHFGNTSPAAGSAAEALSEEPMGTEPARVTAAGSDVTSLAFADLASTRVIKPSIALQVDDLARADAAAPDDLLLLTAAGASGMNTARDSGVGSITIEPAVDYALRDIGFELITSGLETSLSAV